MCCTTTLQDQSMCLHALTDPGIAQQLHCADCGEPVCDTHRIEALPPCPTFAEVYLLKTQRSVSICVTCKTATELRAIATRLTAIGFAIRAGSVHTGVGDLRNTIADLSTLLNRLNNCTDSMITAVALAATPAN